MKIQEFIKKTHKDDKYLIRPQIICNDGFKMSVQASEFHYCSPRILAESYNSVEVGFPSRRELLMFLYAEDPKRLTKTVYGYVPVDIINQVIEKHGGINESKTFATH